MVQTGVVAGTVGGVVPAPAPAAALPAALPVSDERSAMAEQVPSPQNPALSTPGSDAADLKGGQRLQVRVYDQNLRVCYANSVGTHATDEEVVLDLFVNVAMGGGPFSPTQGEPGAARMMMMHMENRVIMNFKTAKAVAIALSQLVRQHEQQHGEIDVDGPPQRTKG